MDKAQTKDVSANELLRRFNVLLESIDAKLAAGNDADKAAIERDEGLAKRLDEVKDNLQHQLDVFTIETRGKFEALAKRFDGVDKRFDGVDKRLGGVDKRLGSVEVLAKDSQKRLKRVETRLKRVETRLVGVEVLAKDGQHRLKRIETHLELGPYHRTVRASSRRDPTADDALKRQQES
jgi:chromosome segregation ATPase